MNNKTPYQRSASPTQVDQSGQRRRQNEYIQQSKEQIKTIKSDPDYVKHKKYEQPTASRRIKNKTLIVILAVFLFYAISLFSVYLIATAIKNADAPTPPYVTTPQDDVPTDTAKGSDTETEKTDDLPPEPESIYAIATPDTVSINSNVQSEYAILIDRLENKIVATKNYKTKIYPASMTKIMTLLVAVENMRSLDQEATVTMDTINYCIKEEASVADFKANETVTVKDLLYGTILPSGADATKTLAECISGSEEEFVKLMNKKVQELGLVNTHFENTSGLHDPNHYSTVEDISVILNVALENDICFEILTSRHYVTTPTSQHPNGLPLQSIVHTRTKDVNIPSAELMGGKTGYTPEAGQCLASYLITNDNREYILVTAKAADKETAVSDAKAAYTTYVPKKEEIAA